MNTQAEIPSERQQAEPDMVPRGFNQLASDFADYSYRLGWSSQEGLFKEVAGGFPSTPLPDRRADERQISRWITEKAFLLSRWPQASASDDPRTQSAEAEARAHTLLEGLLSKRVLTDSKVREEFLHRVSLAGELIRDNGGKELSRAEQEKLGPENSIRGIIAGKLGRVAAFLGLR